MDRIRKKYIRTCRRIYNNWLRRDKYNLPGSAKELANDRATARRASTARRRMMLAYLRHDTRRGICTDYYCIY